MSPTPPDAEPDDYNLLLVQDTPAPELAPVNTDDGAGTSYLPSAQCPPGQHYDPIQKVCVLDAGSPATTTNGIVLPSNLLPSTIYTLDPINYTNVPEHKANGSFREHFMRNGMDLNCAVVGGYILTDGPDDEEITIKLGGGTQTDSDTGISGRCYDIGLNLAGTKIKLRKESRHAEYHETGIENVLNFGARQFHYTGLIATKMNVIFAGEECVRIKAFIDVSGMNDIGNFTASYQHWVQILDAIDTGYWFDRPWLTVAKPGDSRVTIRVDQQEETTYDFKFGFCAKINGGPANY
jgi:hypothetical protein